MSSKDEAKPIRTRLDVLLVERGLAESRAKAAAMIMSGGVYSGETRLDKPGMTVAGDAPLEVRERLCPWVSRGGLKLERALGHFNLPVADAVAADIGASTGGFTDVLLHT
jgi:23S rRNA (cytidine1920-2'-O)/16S rRNA (cytidine1409-2'-O)-methyltransferase